MYLYLLTGMLRAKVSTPGIVVIMFAGIATFLWEAMASDAMVFERGSSSLPTPVPTSTVPMDSEVRCALPCSWNMFCDFYDFSRGKLVCLQYQASGWRADVVTVDADSYLSFKGKTCRCGSKTGKMCAYISWNINSRSTVDDFRYQLFIGNMGQLNCFRNKILKKTSGCRITQELCTRFVVFIFVRCRSID